MKRTAGLLLFSLAGAVSGCALQKTSVVTPETLSQRASAWPLAIDGGRLFTSNDAAFLSKIRLLKQARSAVDLSYYIFSDDESSSVLAKELLAAAARGVKVRLLVDYQTNYKRLDFFSMLEKEGNGNIQVRLYGRPTANIVKDAVFMTMGCGKDAAGKSDTNCSAEKYAAIDKLFADEMIGGAPAKARNISNLNSGNSGLFLSGLYAKNADALALAVQSGQGLDLEKMRGGAGTTSPAEKEQLKELGKVYWQAKTGGPLQRLAGNAQLFFAFAMYGQQLNPLKDAVTSTLPVDRALTAEESRDWDHFTDYTHHKFLLVDGTTLQMGGRNVENSYHMRPNPLVSKYTFMDTDITASVTSGGEALSRAFDGLWGFTPMVATLGEVRQHAPNDFVVNVSLAKDKCAKESDPDACAAKEMATDVQSLDERMAAAKRAMDAASEKYESQYRGTIPASEAAAGLALDRGSQLAYLENLPFDRSLPADRRQRTYGASVGEEARGGKYIHDIWLQELSVVCGAATASEPKRVILHNAYFFPAANLTTALSKLVDGTYDCANVTVTVLTNSIDTTDLNVVNLAARHSLKAFTEFYQRRSDPARRARFEYLEYQRPASGPNLSLHSKVSVFGDDVIVGSANADVRSFMMDSNNALLVRNAPVFAKGYLSFLQAILDEPGRVKNLNAYFAATPRDGMLQEDLSTFRQLLAKYHAERYLAGGLQQQVEDKFRQMLDEAYTMTKDMLDPELPKAKRVEVQNRFNELFKPI